MHALTRRWFVAVVVVLCAVAPAGASHHVFSSSVDRVELDGNVFGSVGGALDFVDEFDDGVLGPEWSILLGTADEAGGVATMHNPGTDISVGIPLDVSNIEKEDAITDGAGDLTATSYWLPQLPDVDDEFHMQTYALGPVIEAAGMTVNNLSAAAAAQLPGGIAGPSITAALTIIDGSGFNNPVTMTVPINAGDVSGHIVLRFSFDDTTNILTCSFSLNDGVTFQSPFPPIPIFTHGVTATELLLGANGGGSDVIPPQDQITLLPTAQLLVVNKSLSSKRKIVYTVKQDNGPLAAGNPINGGGVYAVKLDGNTQCFPLPAQNWVYTASGRYRYKDKVGVYGPVSAAQLERTTRGQFRLKIVALGKLGPINLVPPAAQADINVSLGEFGVKYCGSTAGGTVVRNDAAQLKVTNAPAPASCPVVTCP